MRTHALARVQRNHHFLSRLRYMQTNKGFNYKETVITVRRSDHGN
jgi:hypothetical protein